MSLNVSLKGTQDYEPVKEGTHLARLVQIIEIGTTSYVWQNKEVSANKVRLVFELPDEKYEKEDGTATVALMSVEFSMSMGAKAKLRKFVENWIGTHFYEGEAQSFDLSTLLDTPAIVTVAHRQKGDKRYADIVSAAPLMKGMTCPKALHDLKEMTYAKWDEAFYQTLPDFLKKKMAETPEYRNRELKGEYEASGIPFD